MFELKDAQDDDYLVIEPRSVDHTIEFLCPSRIVWAEIGAARAFAFSLLELCDSLSIGANNG